MQYINFICPKCKKNSDIIEVSHNIESEFLINSIEKLTTGVDIQGEYINSSDGNIKHFRCSNCDSILPVIDLKDLYNYLNSHNFLK